MAISNASNQIVKVNLIPGIIPSVLHLSQYDTGAGRPITFSVYDGSQAFTIPSGVSIAFEGTKPDGNGFSFTCSKSGSSVLLTNYTNQMTALSGKIMCQLVFTNTSGGRVGSLPVLMIVSPAGINEDTVISDSDIEAIISAQNRYAVLNAKLDTAISAATQDSEVQDIRVKVDGTSATTAGNAVREQITELNDAVFYDAIIALVNKNSGTSSVNDIALGITLEAGKRYTITITSTTPFASNTNVYFRNTSNLNKIGEIASGATTATFTAAPTANATAIRISASMSGAIFTIKVQGPQSKLVPIDAEIEKIEGVLFTRKTVASVSANGGSGASSTIPLGVTLTAGQEYIVTVASTVAFSENSVVRFYESANLNVIGTILAGEYGGTFTVAPSANCSMIRIQGTSPQSVYTITVEQDSDAITDMQDAYVDISGDYTNDFSVDIPMRLEPYLNMLLTSYAYYEGSEAPTIRASRQWNAADNSIIRWNSPKYIIGGKNSWKLQTWRIPPYIDGMPYYTHVAITVPTGTTLHIKQLKNTYCDDIDRPFSGVRFYAHGMCGFGAPNNTSLAFEMSAKLGYSYCIAIPKVTSDGVLVCLHDDTSIQATARNDDGTEIAAQYQNVPINEFTYEQLLQFDFGIFRGLPFAGLRIPTIEEFFRICAMTGMHPMFSVHVFSPLNDKWEEIKLLAKKYGVLHHLGIKADRNTISIPMAVLGDEVESYNLFSSAPASELITQFNRLKETYGISKARCTIEYAYAYLTQEYATAVINAGFELACNAFYTSITTTYTDMIDNLIKMGVTEFVEDYNCSSGLNW